MDDYSSVAMGNQATVAMDHQPTVATDNQPTVAMDNNSQAAVAVDNQTEAVVDNKQAVMEKAAVVPAGGGTVATDDDVVAEVAGGNDEDGDGATGGREEKKKKMKKEKKEEKKKKRRRSKKKQKNAKKKTPPGPRGATAAAQPADEAEGVRVKKCTRGERRRWDKSHYCVFCRRPQMKIGRHLLVAHRTEAEVQKAAAFAKGSKQRLLLLEQLRCRGDYRHNIEVIRRGQGEIVTCRQPSQEVNASDFLPCTLCLGFFLKDDLWKHMATCRRKTGGVPADPGPLGQDMPPGGGALPAGRKRRRVQADASRLLPISDGATEKCSDIIHRMHHDPVSQQVKCDWLICQYGSRLMGAGQEVKYDAISQRMRELARFLLVVKSLDAGVRSLSELLEPDRVELAVNAARQALGSRPRKLLAVLRAVCDITVTEKMAAGDWAAAAMVTEFSERLTSVWDKQTAPVVGGTKWKRPASVQSGSELFRVKAKPGLGSKFKLSHLPFSGQVLEKTTDFTPSRLSHGPSTSSSVAGGSVGGSVGGSGGGGSVGGPNNNNNNNNSKQNNNNNNNGGKMRRRPWSGEEKEAVFRHLGFYVLIHNVPGKEACMRCLDMEPCLRNRHWKDIKNQVHNQIESHKKQMFHCQADAPGGGGGGVASSGTLTDRGGVASSSCDIIQEAELRGGGGRKRNRVGGVAMRGGVANEQQHHNLDDNRGVASFRGVGVASSDHQSVERGGGGAIRSAVIGPASPPDSLLAIRGGGGTNHSADPRMERGGAIIRGGASPQLERGGGGVADGLAQLANQERDKYIISENQPIMMEPAHMMLDCLPGADRQMERLQTLTGRQTDRQTDEQLHVGLHSRQTGGLQLADRHVDRQTGGLQLTDRQVDRQTGGLQLSRQTDRHYQHNSRQTVRQTDRQAVGGMQQQQTDRQGGAGLQFNGQLSEAINRHLTWSPPIEQQPIPTQHYGHAHF